MLIPLTQNNHLCFGMTAATYAVSSIAGEDHTGKYDLLPVANRALKELPTGAQARRLMFNILFTHPPSRHSKQDSNQPPIRDC